MSSNKTNLSLAPAEGDPPEKENKVRAPTVITPGGIAEEVYNRRSRPAFALKRFASDAIEIVDEVETEENEEGGPTVYVPVDNDHLRKGMVLVPDGPVECTFDEVYAEACDLAFEIYDCEENKKNEFKLLVALAIGSWFLDRFNPSGAVIAGIGKFAPIISIRGRSGSGKNRALNALRLVSYRPFFDLATARTPSLYRPLDLWKGTLCLDECDIKGNEQSDFIHFINSRAYGTPISRQNPESVAFADVFVSFGLTIVTQRRSWHDDATENRTLPHYATKSQKALPTAELDSWIERAYVLQNKLLYLRLKFWNQVKIDKAARIEGVSDHRLTAAVLPLLALKDFAPSMVANLKRILQEFERKRKEVRAGSSDGIVINALWSRIEEGLFGEFNRCLYVGRERVKEKGVGGEDSTYVVPLTTSDLAESLKWSSASALRRVVHSLQLCERTVSDKIRVGRRVYNPIWFDPLRVEPLLCDFVVDYEGGALQKVLAGSGLEPLPALEPEHSEQPEQRGASDGNAGQLKAKAQNVPDVPDVPVSMQGGAGEKDEVSTDGSPASTLHPHPTDAGTVTSVTRPEAETENSEAKAEAKAEATTTA